MEQSRLIEITRNSRQFKVILTDFGEKILEQYSYKIFKPENNLFEMISGDISDNYIKKEMTSQKDIDQNQNHYNGSEEEDSEINEKFSNIINSCKDRIVR